MATRTKNAVAAKQTTAVSTVSYEDEVAALAKRLQMNTGDRIKINLSKFSNLFNFFTRFNSV